MKAKKQRKVNSQKTGFTIVEVTLVTAFVAMLLIAITVIVMHISSVFQKGLTLKAVNSVGRNLVEELTSAINDAPSLDTTSLCNTLLGNDTARNECKKDGAYKYIYQSSSGTSTDNVTGLSNPVQYNGVFCTGKYSYIWNTHYGIKEEVTIEIETTNDGRIKTEKNRSDRPFRIVRIDDRTYRACSVGVKTNAYEFNFDATSKRTVDIRKLANGTANDSNLNVYHGLLDKSDSASLDLYELTLFPPSQDSVTLRAFFAGTFILATETGNVNITRAGDYCDITGQGEEGEENSSSNLMDLGSNFNYCAINKFNFAARTAGSGI